MKLIEFHVSNVKRVELVEIVPGDDALVQITGRNAQGKSSTLDALSWLFDGAAGIDADPIREGQQKAVIRGNLGDIIVTRTLTRSDGPKPYTTKVTVEAADGSRRSKPQDVLDSFMSALSLDPIEFMHADAKAQYDMLRGFVPGVDFDAITAADAKDYAQRTEVNREIARLKQGAAAILLPGDPPLDQPLEAVDEAALLERMATAAQVNASIEQERSRRARETGRASDMRADAAGKRSHAEELRRQATALDEAAGVVEAAAAQIMATDAALPALADAVDVTDVRTQIEQARVINAQVQRRKEHNRLMEAAGGKEWDAEALTEAMAEREEAKRMAIAEAQMPVEGLGFGDKAVLFNGHPLRQASGAEQLRISVAIAMAMNPTLRVIRIRDGNSLDDRNLALLRDMAERHDYQVWIERVLAADRVGFVIEDGRVVSAQEAA